MELKGVLCEFESSDNYKFVGLLNDVKSKIALIHIHGMGSFFWKGNLVYEACENSNIGCFLINHRGSGPINQFKNSIEDKDKLLAGTGLEIFEDSIKDVEGAINFLKIKGYEKFIICGHSTGSQKSLYFGLNYKKQNEIIGYILLSPCDDFNVFREKFIPNFDDVLKQTKQSYDSKIIFAIPEIGYFSSKRFYDLLKEGGIEGDLLNYRKSLIHIKKFKQPILAILAKDEEAITIPIEKMLKKIANNFANKKSRTKIVSGDHSFRGGEKELIKELSNWIGKIV